MFLSRQEKICKQGVADIHLVSIRLLRAVADAAWIQMTIDFQICLFQNALSTTKKKNIHEHWDPFKQFSVRSFIPQTSDSRAC